MLDRMQSDSDIPAALRPLRSGGWGIQKILARMGVGVSIHGNPGRFAGGKGLLLEAPRRSPHFSKAHGIDKRAAVPDSLSRYRRVAITGNGPP